VTTSRPFIGMEKTQWQPGGVLRRKNKKLVRTKPFEAAKNIMETHHLSSRHSLRQKYPEPKTTITFYPNTTPGYTPSNLDGYFRRKIKKIGKTPILL